MIQIPSDVQNFLDSLRSAVPEIESIWLIGSRANPNNPPRDWDFLVFVDQGCLSVFSALRHLRRGDIDVLVVTDGNNFEEMWFEPSPERRNPKRGLLVEWEWKIVSDSEARYIGAKARPNSVHIDIEEKRAICLWRASRRSIAPAFDTESTSHRADQNEGPSAKEA